MNTQLPEKRAQRIGRNLAVQRSINGISLDDTAAILGVSSDEMLKYETGELSPSLPQLESLALFFKTPLVALTAENPIESEKEVDSEKIKTVIGLRNRIIAAMIKRTRLEQNRSLKDLAASLGVDESSLESCESGKVSIPLPDLEVICSELGISINALANKPPQQTTGQSVEMDTTEPKSSIALPQDLYDFVANNANLPYIQLAKRLSEMDAEKLRNIAEGLLEITY